MKNLPAWLLRALIAMLIAALAGPASVLASGNPQSGSYGEVVRIGRGPVYKVAWSPDGRYIAAGGEAGIWIYHGDMRDVGLLRNISGVTTLAWSPDGTKLAASSWNSARRTVVWDNSWRVIGTFDVDSGSPSALGWDPSGTRLAIGDQSGGVTVFRVDTGERIAAFKHAGETRVKAIGWTPDGSQVRSMAVAEMRFYAWEIASWDIASGQQLAARHALSISPDRLDDGPIPPKEPRSRTEADHFATLVHDYFLVWAIALLALGVLCVAGMIRVWNSRFHLVGRIGAFIGLLLGIIVLVAIGGFGYLIALLSGLDGDDVFMFPSQGDMTTILADFSPDAGRVAITSWQGGGTIYDVGTGENTGGAWDERLHNSYGIDWSADSRQIVLGNIRGLVIWDVAAGSFRLEENMVLWPGSVSWSPDGARVAYAGYEENNDKRVVAVHDIASDSNVVYRDGHISDMRSMAWSPDGALIAGELGWPRIRDEAQVTIWDTASGDVVQTLAANGSTAVAWSPDGTVLAAMDYNRKVELWDPAAGVFIRTLQDAVPNAPQSGALAWSPDSTRVAASSKGNDVLVWEAASGREVMRIWLHAGSVNAIAWSADGKLIATGSDDHAVGIWDASSGWNMQTWRDSSREIRAVSFSPDSKRLAVSNRDDVLTIIDAVTGKAVSTIDGFRLGGPQAWSPDGMLILGASCAQQQTAPPSGAVCLLDVATGAVTLTPGWPQNVTVAGWESSGGRFASAGTDGTIRIWAKY